MTVRAVALLLLLAGCATDPRPGPWVVSGGADAATAAEALEVVEAGRRVYGPGSPLEIGRRIFVAPEVATLCYGPLAAGAGIAGCTGCGGVCLLWPHPKCPPAATLAECSALAHELAHLAGAETEAEAGAGSLLIVQEWRRGLP